MEFSIEYLGTISEAERWGAGRRNNNPFLRHRIRQRLERCECMPPVAYIWRWRHLFHRNLLQLSNLFISYRQIYIIYMIKSLLCIPRTYFLFFFIFLATQASLPIDLGQEGSQTLSKKKKMILISYWAGASSCAYVIDRPNGSCGVCDCDVCACVWKTWFSPYLSK